MKRFFSVIVPTYNREATIGDTLESIRAQRYMDWELFVVDDGSCDRTCEIVEHSSLGTLIRQGNRGPGSARNRGVVAATGDYIAFLDSDDIWFPWALQTYERAIKQSNYPAFATARPACFETMNQTSCIEESAMKCLAYPDYFATGDQWLWHGVSSFVIRRDVFLAAGGFAEGRINGEDAELAMRLGTAPGFVHISNPPMFGYRVHPGNVTLDREKSKAGLNLLIDGERQGRFPGGKERAKERATIISRHVRPFAIESAKRGDCRTAMSMYMSVIREAFRRRRMKFILGLPILCVLGMVKALFRR